GALAAVRTAFGALAGLAFVSATMASPCGAGWNARETLVGIPHHHVVALRILAYARSVHEDDVATFVLVLCRDLGREVVRERCALLELGAGLEQITGEHELNPVLGS